jgi:hypothetical protein
MKKLIMMLAIVSGNVMADTVWFNIPSHYDRVDMRSYNALSLPTSSWDACADAIAQYAKDNYVFYVSCDVKPLPNAANLKRGGRNANF